MSTNDLRLLLFKLMILKWNLTFSVLLVQFGDETQFSASQILLHPLIDPTVNFWPEVILPVTRFACFIKFEINYNFKNLTIMNLPLRMNLPSQFMNPSSLQNSQFTASFLVKLSMRRCLTSCVSCPSLRYLPKNLAIFSNSPRKF